MLQCLDTLVRVRMPTPQYPLSRYWLEAQDADFQRGRISAYLEFVEEVVRDRLLGFRVGPDRAVIKKFGFIWVVEEILVGKQVELVVSLIWEDLTAGKASRYEDLVLHTITSLTREIVNRLQQTAAAVQAAPILGPPPVSGAAAPPPASLPPPPPATAAGISVQIGPAVQQKSNRMAFADMSRASRVTVEERTTRLLDWPAPQDFHESVQNPSSCFSDKFLRNGMPELDFMGMPRVSSGAFASVYRIRCLDRDRAVRCFLQPVKDQQYRYEVLRMSVNPLGLPWLVEFDYLARGICVAGKWYPVLSMDWVEGTPLNLHISSLCEAGDARSLEDLRQHFREMSAGLRGCHIAHGDLQHGNILVRDGRLVLVDYDGMFVPGLSRQKSNELGHANYQHPGRAQQHFNETIDHFSAWVIDTALLCLREDPSLIRFCYDGESLLFHRQDFIAPAHSAMLAHLAAHSSEIIRKRIVCFAHLLDLPPEKIPPLAGAAAAPLREDSVRTAGSQTVADVENKGAGLPDWLADVDY
jgi:hypothetical protein